MKGKKQTWFLLALALICFAAFWTAPVQAASDTGVTLRSNLPLPVQRAPWEK